MGTKPLLFCCLLLPFLGESQTRPTLDVLTGYEYSNLISDRQVFVDPDQVMSTTSLGIYTFRYGLNYNQPIAQQWTLKLGLRYVQNGEKDLRELRWGAQFDGTGGFVDNGDQLTLHDRYRFLSVPLALRYSLGATNKKLNFYLEAGGAAARYLNTKSTSTVTGEGSKATSSRVDKVDAIRRWHLLGNLAFGVNYQLAGRTQIFLQPTFRYYLTPLADGPFKEHLYNVGLELGGRYALR